MTAISTIRVGRGDLEQALAGRAVPKGPRRSPTALTLMAHLDAISYRPRQAQRDGTVTIADEPLRGREALKALYEQFGPTDARRLSIDAATVARNNRAVGGRAHEDWRLIESHAKAFSTSDEDVRRGRHLDESETIRLTVSADEVAGALSGRAKTGAARALAAFSGAIEQDGWEPGPSGRLERTGEIIEGRQGLSHLAANFGDGAYRTVTLDTAKLAALAEGRPESAIRELDLTVEAGRARRSREWERRTDAKAVPIRILFTKAELEDALPNAGFGTRAETRPGTLAAQLSDAIRQPVYARGADGKMADTGTVATGSEAIAGLIGGFGSRPYRSLSFSPAAIEEALADWDRRAAEHMRSELKAAHAMTERRTLAMANPTRAPESGQRASGQGR